GGNGGTGGVGCLGFNRGESAPGGAGGDGGAGAYLNGGTLTTSGTISGGAGGAGGSGATNGAAGAAGDAVQFGSVASALVVEPGAVFNGQVAANASVNDVLKLSGVQSGGTPITLGTQFTGFHKLDFVSGAAWTVDATRADLTAHTLSIEGFALADKLDITNLAEAGTTSSFNTTTDVLTITKGATTIKLQFASSFSGEHFVLSPDGHGGTDVHLKSGAAATLAASGHDLMNFVGDEHRALMGDRLMLGDPGKGSGFTLHPDPALDTWGAHGFSANAFTDHGLAHTSVMFR
ncbi:MAG TPA: hypothetical protein VIH50_01985, partial [Steroidobacteraceae bacterium]